jgi:pseudouridine synthase
VDGQVLTEPAAQIREGADLHLDGEPLPLPLMGAAFHKPPGVQCTVGDPLGRTSLQETAAPLLEAGLHPVGRLDADSEGLLLFLADGRQTQHLLHPKHAVEKLYEATVTGPIPEDLDEQLAAGVPTALGVFPARLVDVQTDADGGVVTLGVTEGKHRMVRRMLANLGLPVQRLVRRRLGGVVLGDLPSGAWRPLTAEEMADLSGSRVLSSTGTR